MTQGLFQFNNSTLKEIIEFVSSSFDLFFLSGPKGSSKSETIERAIPELAENNLVFRHFCFEDTVIDDFLLNFYDELKNFSLLKKISLKKFTDGTFKERVSHYFRTIAANCIIIVENFEKVESNVEIVDFLSHLANYNNVKIIVVTRNPDKNLFRFKEVRMKTASVKFISKDDFKAKLEVFTQPLSDEVKENFYNITTSSELYLNMSIKYCINTGHTIVDLTNEFERRSENFANSFESFIVSKIVSLTPTNYREFFRFISLIPHPVSMNFIQGYNLGTVEYVDYLTKNFIVSKFNDDEIYVKDYFRTYTSQTIPIKEKNHFYKTLIDIYNNELTKSPKDRLLRLSRESIRKVINHFETITPEISKPKETKNVSYIGLSNFNFSNQPTPKNSLAEKFNKIKERKQKLTETENKLLIAKRLQESNQTSIVDENKEKNRRFIIDLINKARDLSSDYKYKDAITELIRAQDVDYTDEFRIETDILIAQNYEHLNEYQQAQKHYNSALGFAEEFKDNRRCEIEYAIAQINKNLYNMQVAREQFKLIALNGENSEKYRAMASIDLGEIEESNSNFDNAIKHYQNALSFSLGLDKELTCKAYYRLAILFDETGDFENAIKYYKKNYTTSSDKAENKYYSISLTNLALIYIENGRYKEASEFLKLALTYDSENNDYENIYFSQKELAKLYSNFDISTALSYYKQALNTARTLKDNFKIALIHFETGELFYDKSDDEKALVHFLNARNALKSNNHDENVQRINSRIQDIKIRLDNATYNLIMEKYDKH